jgi:TonB-linked SusC/RagA family outer membrane protein
MAQERTISGKVTTEEDGSALPGVNVVVKGSSRGSVTNADGVYSVVVNSDNDVVVFSFIGFKTQEITVGNRAVLDVALATDATNLEEVVITGLATSIKRSNLANAVATISAKDLIGTTRAQTLDGALYGKLNGAMVRQNGGGPGGGLSVQLRGVSTISGSNEPLYIIDGVYVNNSQFDNGRGSSAFNSAGGNLQSNPANRISDIDPADIENIEVLKGSSAAAIYGSRANNGVIIITTRRGKSGVTEINLQQDIGVATILKKLGQDSWDNDKIDLVYGAGSARATLEKQRLADALASGGLVDWEDEFFGEKALLSNTKLSISGGTDKTKFFVSGSITDEEGIIRRTGFQRYSIRSNIDHKFNDIIDLNVSSNYIKSTNQRGYNANSNNDVSLSYQFAYTPNYANFLKPNEQGIYPDNPYMGENPYAIIDRAINDETTHRFIQSGSVTAHLLNKPNFGLRFNFQGGIDYLVTTSFLHLPNDMQSQTALANPGAARNTKNNNFNSNLQGFFIADWQLAGLQFTTQAGFTRLYSQYDVSFVQGTGLPSGIDNPATGANLSFGQTYQKWQDVGIAAQQEINYQDKLIGTFGIRMDKSSLNGDIDKFYPFKKASFATNLHNFDFFPDGIISQLKLRTAYGETGGVPLFGDTYTAIATTNLGGELGIFPAATIGNENIEPEKASEFEFGLDLGLLNNRISLEATVYKKKVTDLIRPFVLAPSTGTTSVKAFPVGDLENRGIEIALNAQIVKSENIEWNTGINWWKNESEITRSIVPVTNIGPGFGTFYGANKLQEGQSPTMIFGQNTDGDDIPLGDTQPDYQLSWSNNVRILQNFELSFLFHMSEGNHLANIYRLLTAQGGTNPEWRGDEDGDGTINGIQWGASEKSTDYILDASYIRLREVALYYTLPKSIVNSAFNGKIRNARIGISGNNVWMNTDYPGWSPEVSQFSNRPVGNHVDLGSYPESKRFFFHLNVTF